jgi:hypothetical protein
MLGLGTTWAVVWGVIFGTLGIVIGILDPASIDPGEDPLRIAGYGAAFGFISGVAFGGILALGEHRKSIQSLSTGRAALWGALGTSLFPLLTQVDNSMALLFGPIGAALGAAMVAIARRAGLRSGDVDALAAEDARRTLPSSR